MSLRTLLKKDPTHFLVKYTIDKKTQIRTRGLIKTEDEVKVSALYEVQWGRAGQVSTALVLGAGTEAEMKKLHNGRHVTETTDDTPNNKRRKTVQKKTTVQDKKKTANVINRSQSSQSSDDEPEADYQPPTLAPLSSFCNPTVPTSLHSPSHITQNQSGQSTSVPQQSFFSPVMQNFSDLLFSTEDTSTNQQIDFLDASLTDFLPTPHRPRNNVIEKKLDQMNKRLNTLERNQVDIKNILGHILQSLQQQQPPQQQPPQQQPPQQPPQQPQPQQQQPQPPTDSNLFCDIPEPYHISLEELIKVDKAAFNAGNFSCKLVNRLFPELFGPDHLRTKYSYHGQGKTNKFELDPIRKGYIQRYVLYLHPDVKDPKFYQNIVVVKINEMLRCPVKPTDH